MQNITPNAWTSAGNMNDARAGHASIWLPSASGSHLLVCGGYGTADSNGNWPVLASAELFDPYQRQWTRIAPMNDARCNHTATMLGDGRILVAGGYGSRRTPDGGGLVLSMLATAEIFNPKNGTWTRVPNMFYSHAEHTATLLTDRDQSVFIVDGIGDFNGQATTLDTLEWFDPATWSWSMKNSGDPRYAATATLLDNSGFVLVSGGSDATDMGFIEQPTAQSFVYDPYRDTLIDSWVLSNSNCRAWHTATHLFDGTVLLAGGGVLDANSDTGPGITQLTNTPIDELYDPNARILYQTANMQQRRHGHTATLLDDKTVLVAGGSFFDISIGPPFYARSLASVEVYHPSTSTQPPGTAFWQDSLPLQEARSGHTANFGDSEFEMIIVAGGIQYPSGTVLASTETFP